MDLDSLDELYRAAKAAVRAEAATKRAAAKKGLTVEEDQDLIGLYKNPANWTATRGIALIHADTQTLLGNFTEYRHKTDVSARRLVREPSPLPISATEFVSGDWWMLPTEIPTPKRAWQTQLPATLMISLNSLHVYAPDISVTACFGVGRLDRVELTQETLFAQSPGTTAQLITLPPGTNILPLMSQESIRLLKAQLNQPLS
jgi:hypothetical protein